MRWGLAIPLMFSFATVLANKEINENLAKPQFALEILDIFGPDIYDFKGFQLFQIQNLEEKARSGLTLLEKYIFRLKEFVNNTKFDNLKFLGMALLLKLEISDIESSIQEVVTIYRSVSDRVRFAKYMFEIFEACTEYLSRNDHINSPEDRWIEGVIQINILLLSSFKAENNLVPTIDIFAKAVYCQLLFLQVWEDLLKYLIDAPFRIRMLIYQQVIAGEEMLQILTCEEENLLDNCGFKQ